MKQLLCLLVLVLITSLSFAAGEGGWRKYNDPDQAWTAFLHPVFSYKNTVALECNAGLYLAKLNEDGSFSRWTANFPLIGKNGYWSSGCASDKYIYISGGETWGTGVLRNSVYQLQVISDDSVAFVSSGSMTQVREMHGSMVINNDKLYIFGGYANGVGMSYTEYCQLDSKTGNMGSFQAGPTFNKINSNVFASFILNNTVYCLGLENMPRFYIESAPILADNTLGPWKVAGGPYAYEKAPIGATFTGDSTLFVMIGGKESNPCYVMDLKDGTVEGKSFKVVTSPDPISPKNGFYLPSTIGIGSWGRYVCYLNGTYTYVYDPWLTSAPLFEESNSNLYE